MTTKRTTKQLLHCDISVIIYYLFLIPLESIHHWYIDLKAEHRTIEFSRQRVVWNLYFKTTPSLTIYCISKFLTLSIKQEIRVSMNERRKMPNVIPIYRSLVWTSIACLFLSPCSAYSPIVNHRAIAGIWKLKQTSITSSPLKEFTVYPKASKKRNSDENKEVLLMLKEDGSFQQYSEEQQQVPDKLRFFNNYEMDEKANETAVLDRYCEFGKLKGKWELVGDKLILAADRPIGDDGRSSSIPKTNDDTADTILEGEVVATTEEGLLDNPVLSSYNDDPRVDDYGNTGASSSSSNKSKPDSRVGDRNDAKSSRGGKGNSRSSVVDTHLSVPKGQVNVGRFTYPLHHPSFFEAPMFNPRAGGKFELRQVLGTLNTQQEKDNEEFEEKFSQSDFYDKTFLLTSHPIPDFQPKGNTRWSIRQNKFVGTCD
jgi:hypothetical protein